MAVLAKARALISGGWPRDLITLATIALIMAGLYQLPADTSLQEVRAAGRLSVCLPADLPPLVEARGQAGRDVDLMRALAARMGLRFVPSVNTAIGRDFNPRNWRLSRAQCQIVAGGVVASAQVTSFMETLTLPFDVGWSLLGAQDLQAVGAAPLGIYPGIGGLDRLRVSEELHRLGLSDFQLYHSEAEAATALDSGAITALLTDSLTAARLSSAARPAHLLEKFERHALAIALWRGDVSLLKEVDHHLQAMRADGTLAAIYGADLRAVGTK